MDNYVIRGFGKSHGKHEIDNDKVCQYVESGLLAGFQNKKVESSDSYKEFIQHKNISAFDFFVSRKMGFEKRRHVVSFPPTEGKYFGAETALDLAVRACDDAINDAGINPENIDLWLGGNATPFEQAPGIAATVKSFFCTAQNKTPASTINSACVGFNINIERAIDYFKSHEEAQYIIVFHTEVMSKLLLNEKSFVPHVTFSDAAAAVIIKREQSETREGFIDCINFEDPEMLDFLGANDKGDLYMNPYRVKIRATENLVDSTTKLMAKNNIKESDINLFIPHQTGDAIVKEAAQRLGITDSRLFQEVQREAGNLSGASVPYSLCKLKEEGRLISGNKVVTSVAGLGGEFGAFYYIVPEKELKIKEEYLPLKGKKVFITGGTGGIGSFVAEDLASKGADLIIHYNKNEEKKLELDAKLKKYPVQISFIQANFANDSCINNLIDKIKTEYSYIHSIIHTAAVTGGLNRASKTEIDWINEVNRLNFEIPQKINEALFEMVSNTVLFIGSVAEDARFPGSAPYVVSKTNLHQYAVSFANKAFKNNVRVVYYMPGIVDIGMTSQLNNIQQEAAMSQIGQKMLINPIDISSRIVKSLYLLKVLGVNDSYENNLIIRRDGYYWPVKK